MMESIVAGLEDWGLPGCRIHFEVFGPALVKRVLVAAVARRAASTSAPPTITVGRTGSAIRNRWRVWMR
jgi:ferredoxin-NADP reductase